MREPGLERRQFLTRITAATVALMFPPVGAGATGHSSKPNFIIILGEAHGWNSVSMNSDPGLATSNAARTPNLDRLAARGMRFTKAYASSPRCMPSRAALLTGKTPAQLHMTFVVDENEGKDKLPVSDHPLTPPSCVLELPTSEKTVAETLKACGYATAHFGKWHLGRRDPSEHGFDESDGATSNRGPNGAAKPNPEQAHAITARGAAFARRQALAGKPFYLQLSHYNASNPDEVSPGMIDAYIKRTGETNMRTAAMRAGMEEMDATIGNLLTTIEELGIGDNTYIVYTSDHGGQGTKENAPLSGGKGTLYEGGLRVPLIIQGPGIKPNSVCSTPAVIHDLFPTIAELSKAPGYSASGLEGASLAPILLGDGAGTVKRPRQELVFHFPHYDHDPAGPGTAILMGDYKLIRFYETGTLHLFDLSQDIGEQRDLSASLPDKAKELTRRMDTYLAEVSAQLPTPNAAYRPGNRPVSEPPGRRQKRGGTGRGEMETPNGKGKRKRNAPDS